MYKRICISILTMLVTVQPLKAQWIFQGSESAFGDDAVQLAMTMAKPYALGARCKGDKIDLVYITPDTSFDKDSYAGMNAMMPEMKVRIDDNPIVVIDAELVDSEGKMLGLAETDTEMLTSIKNAKRRIAIALSVLGKNYHEQSFSVQGSTAAIEKLFKGCNLKTTD